MVPFTPRKMVNQPRHNTARCRSGFTREEASPENTVVRADAFAGEPAPTRAGAEIGEYAWDQA